MSGSNKQRARNKAKIKQLSTRVAELEATPGELMKKLEDERRVHAIEIEAMKKACVEELRASEAAAEREIERLRKQIRSYEDQLGRTWALIEQTSTRITGSLSALVNGRTHG